MLALKINTLLIIVLSNVSFSYCCSEVFEGFGAYLGSVGHFSRSPQGTVKNVFEKVYSDLGIRHYRTSYESVFSPAPNVYEISCKDNTTCFWIEVHNEISKYSDISIMASIWGPPYYMKNNQTHTLLISQEPAFHHFINNITNIIKSKFNITIERVSPVNEPENIFAPWEHCNMQPNQLCRMVNEFKNPMVSICPENSYYLISETYWKFGANDSNKCSDACEIFGTHAYALTVDSDVTFQAYYDLTRYKRKTTKPIWMTEVSSTFGGSRDSQIQEALDMSMNIVNFVAHTCIQRYYYWLSYTLGASGESLIWGSGNGELRFPKKYYAYKHFTLAAQGGPKKISVCDSKNLAGLSCITFDGKVSVFVNTLNTTIKIDWEDDFINCKTESFCCTSNSSDWDCGSESKMLPQQSICSCKVVAKGISTSKSGKHIGEVSFVWMYFSILLLSVLLS